MRPAESHGQQRVVGAEAYQPGDVGLRRVHHEVRGETQ